MTLQTAVEQKMYLEALKQNLIKDGPTLGFAFVRERYLEEALSKMNAASLLVRISDALEAAGVMPS